MSSPDYIKMLEEQNEQLKEALAQEQLFTAKLHHNVYIINFVFGIEHLIDHSCFSIISKDNLEAYVKKWSVTAQMETENLKFLGYRFTTPSFMMIKQKMKNVIQPEGGESHWFNRHFENVEGFEYNHETDEWQYKDSGNAQFWNGKLVEDVAKWHQEAIDKGI
jgi:hypothetical protein